MNRRNFLKKMGAACVGVIITSVVATTTKEKVKDQSAFLIDCDTWNKERQQKGVLHEQLCELTKATSDSPYGVPYWIGK